MKSNYFNHIFGVSMISFLCFSACSSDVDEAVIPVTTLNEEAEMQSMPMCMYGGIMPFDATSSTRADVSDWTWKNGDVVYIQFHNGESLIRGHAQYDAESQQWSVSYSGTISQSDICEVYYFEGASAYDKHKTTFNETNAVYACTSADYYISDNTVCIEAILTPLTSRVKFAGVKGLGMSVEGITHYTGYDADKNTFTTSSSIISQTVGADGYTKYVYGMFSDESRHLNIINSVNNGVFFEKDFPASVLRIGESGIITIPTFDTNRGWKESVSVTSVTLSRNNATIVLGKTLQLDATVMPANATYNTVIWTSSNEKVATVDDNGLVTSVSYGSATIRATSVKNDSKYATCSITVVDANGHEYVDLGLPSGILWATCNVGATVPDEYGDYFAWGETTTKIEYTSSNYTYTANPSTLPSDKDAAYVNWGGNWRMPTTAEQDELRSSSYCTWTWTTQDGVNGYSVSSKTNNNSIFLPAAGYYSGSSLIEDGSYGYYWSSSSSSSSSSYSWCVYFYSNKWNDTTKSKSYGYSVRAVCK